MSFRRNIAGIRSVSAGRYQQSRFNSNNPNIDTPRRKESLPNVLPELTKIVRKLLPQEIPLNIHVRNVEYIENGCERLCGTLYMTVFRLVFSPDNEIANNNLIFSENKYIGEYDIPLTSICKVDVAPVNSRSGFKSFLNENQIQSETRAFTIITRDFRNITFSKCSVTKSNSMNNKQDICISKMETYIEALKVHCRFQNKGQLYPYLAMQQTSMNNLSPRLQHSYQIPSLISTSSGRSGDDDTADFCISNDARIKGYMTYQDWHDELKDANELQWIVDLTKFDEGHIVNQEGPFVRLTNVNENDDCSDLIWHWTHTSEAEINRHHQHNTSPIQYMLVTMPGIGDIFTVGDPVEFPISLPKASSPSSSRFLNLSKRLPKNLRSNPNNDPPMVCTNELKIASSRLLMVPPKSPNFGLRRNATDTNLIYSSHQVYEQSFQRYNLSKFPCNLKRLQTSYEKLIEICVITSDDDDDNKWLSKLNACKWLKYVSKTLHGAASLAKLLNYTNIALVGSDIDNNCLMSSLIQIFLRPKCRTIKGFCELIVREWLIRGHPFRERFGQVLFDTNGNNAQESPVFLLFLDCVHQLINQNSFSFEFTEYFLIELYHSICYCYHHTFVFNSVLERRYAIQNCPRNILFLSSFDFSLYLYPHTYHLLINYTSIFSSQKLSHSHQQTTNQTKRYLSPKQNTSFRQPTNRTTYRLESPKTIHFILDVSSSTHELLPINGEQYEYDLIESPQKFHSDLYVDWRIFNIILWSNCYCRYDQNRTSISREQQLSLEINYLQESIQNPHIKSRRQTTIDAFHAINHANSWHPHTLDTRV
ncbi:unnamed protein product [Rotaria sordida]|uniref:Myotubularin phosphatase domain-containing protein n=1 Tax=Rotaria sordida TaxID=392033 RepID=A0A819MN92_9BILA|nr:unnamed protein product [Rotaria sordida]